MTGKEKDWDTFKDVVRRRLGNTENPSSQSHCATHVGCIGSSRVQDELEVIFLTLPY